MSETPELPPLPEPFKVLLGPLPVFTAQQMREQWEAGRRAGLEEAAKLAMKLHNTGPRAYVPGEPGYAEACAINSTAVAIAGAIRECGGTGRAKP